MPSIFISYRRDDTAGYATAINRVLASRYGSQQVAIDQVIPRGTRYEATIFSHIERCKVVLVLIGPQWLTMQNDRGEVRIVSRDDLVRREIAAALLHKKIIFPVLLHDAKMPSADSLPEDIKALAEFNAERLVDEHWDATLEALLRALDSIVPCAANAAQPAESPNAWWFVKRALLIGVPKSTLGLVLRLIFYAATMATIVLVSAAIRFPDGRLTPQFLLLLAVAAGAAVVTWLLTATSEKHY